jgi:hypothetical protein
MNAASNAVLAARSGGSFLEGIHEVANDDLRGSRGWMALIFGIVIVSAIAGAIVSTPSRWDRAVAIGVCGGLPILRQEDGSVWLRVNSVRAYKVENPDDLRCNVAK